MPGKRGRKQKQDAGVSESSGQTQTTAQIDHAFASNDMGKKKLNLLHKLSRKQWMIVGVIVLLVGAGGYAIWRNTSEPKPEKTVYTKEGVKLRKLNSQQLQDELEKLLFEKKYSSAEELINYQEDAATPELRMLLVATYLDQDKLDDALRVLLEMEKRYPDNWQLDRTIGDVYQRQGNKKEALTYYKKALDLVKKTKAEDLGTRDDTIHLLEQTITDLEGQV